MRVIAGSARGRRLRAPAGTVTRPTSDRVREAVFSSLGERVSAAVGLDLWAGSGAMGIEALSRGAAEFDFVDSDRAAVAAIRSNLAAADVTARARVWPDDVARFARRRIEPATAPADLVFCDPPYVTPMATVVEVIGQLSASGRIGGSALVVVERDKRDAHLDDPLPPLLVEDRRRTYGDTVVLYLQVDQERSP